MIIWINGPFGAGKTTTAELLVARRPELMLFDTEQIAYLLVRTLGERVRARDFQDLVAWRHERWSDFEAARLWIAEATTVIDTSDLRPEGVVDRILEMWASETP